MMKKNITIRKVIPSKTVSQNTTREASLSFKRSSLGGMNISMTFGKVVEVYDDATVNVQIGTGTVLRRVLVPSRSYVASDPAVGSKDMPPIGSLVTIGFPNGSIEEAVVMQSYFTRNDDRQSDFFTEGEARKSKTIEEAGWTTVYDKDTGNYTVTDPDGFSLTVDKVNQTINLTDWNGNIIETASTGMKLTDANGNIVDMASGKVVINGNLEVLQ